MSVNVEYSSKEVSQVVLQNVLKMLVRRNTIETHEKLLQDLTNDFTDKGIVEFQKISINMSNAKLSSIVQGSPLDDYLRNNLDIHKIIIMKEPSKKVIKQVREEYPNAEIFFEFEMMEDIPSKIFIPEHQLLTEDEKKNILETFKETELAKINDTDIMSRYYRAKLGDIFRIIRPSITAGKNIFYRRVVVGKIDQLFEN